MNDNERAPSLGNELIGLIESFAPGYHASLKCYESTKKEIIKLKTTFLALLTVCYIFSIFRTSPINATTVMTVLVTAISVYGLCRVDRLEREIGIWKWGYKPLWGTRMAYPCKWEFHPVKPNVPGQSDAIRARQWEGKQLP